MLAVTNQFLSGRNCDYNYHYCIKYNMKYFHLSKIMYSSRYAFHDADARLPPYSRFKKRDVTVNYY